MRWLLLPLLTAGCLLQPHHQDGYAHNIPIAIDAPNSFYLDTSRGLLLQVIAPPSVSLHALRQRLVLVRSPVSERLALTTRAQHIPLTIKKQEGRIVLSSRTKLASDTLYGVFVRDAEGDFATLLYSFRSSRPPRISSHDLGEGEQKIISPARKRFRLTFDQPIQLTDDDAVVIVSAPGASSPKIDHLLVDSDKKTLWITIDQQGPPWIVGDTYQIVWDRGVQNYQHLATDELPIDIVVNQDQNSITPMRPPVIHSASRFAELLWPFEQERRIEVFMSENGEGPYTLHVPDFCESPHRLKLGTLKARTLYTFIARAEASNAHVIVARGTLKTTEDSGLVITEIMSHPPVTKTFPKSIGAYIEIYNSGAQPIDLIHASLAIETIKTHREKNCTWDQGMVLGPHETTLIVGQDFDPNLFGLGHDTPLIRLAQKSLCHGLAHESPQRIRIFNQEGEMLHLYDTTLMPAKKGMSIVVLPNKGLDDAHNYCYSSPTPGKQNSSCG